MRSSTIIAATLLMAAATLSAQDWGPDVRLTYDPAVSRTRSSSTWSVAVSGDTIHAVWWDNRKGNYEVYYKRSTDNGTTWETDTRLTGDPGESVNTSIAVFGNNVHVVWREDRDGYAEIYYKRSTDGGTTWESDTRLTNTTNYSQCPSIAVSGNNVHVVWDEIYPGNHEIYHKRSTDNGSTWGPNTRLTDASGESTYPSVAVSGNNVHAIWQDHRDGNFEVYYKRSTDNGSSWGSDTRLTNNGSLSGCPSVAVSGNNVHATWQDNCDGNDEIYYKRSSDGGMSWGTNTRLTNNPAASRWPSTAVSGNNIYVVWGDKRDGNWEMYYKRSTDNGATWHSDTRLTDNSGSSLGPSIAVSGTSLHVVWYDNRDGNWEIYYKRYLGVLVIEATVDFDPDKLNFASKGKWVTCYIELPEGYSVEDIDESTVAITEIDGTELDPPLYCEGPFAIGDFNENGITDLMVKFDRQVLIATLKSMGYGDGEEVELTVTGALTTGKTFAGSDCIGVLDKGKGGGQSGDPASAFSFEPVSPNPFSEQASIRYTLPQSSHVQIAIYDALGRQVCTLADAEQDAGPHTLVWDGSDDAGKQLSSGIYFLNFEAGKFSRKAKLVILR